MAEHIDTAIENELQSSYIDYAMSVIISRALPDVRDGLKPAQRRILYAMFRLNNLSSLPTKKSARIVGEVIGKYHPHGDIAAYGTLVNMAQTFSINYPLVEGQGNMGSVDGDPPAAQRYTEVRLSKLSEEMLEDIDKNSVAFISNFDNTETEPVVLPSKVPNLLLNGTTGIAVGVATRILPHNLQEVCDAVIAYIDNKEITPNDLLKYVKGPDFPTGGKVFYDEGLMKSYITGRGSVTIQAISVVETEKNGAQRIIITEIPYSVNKSTLITKIVDLVKSKTVVGISNIRDESDRKGMRIVIELRHGTPTDYVLNLLYKHTQMQITLPVMNLAILGKRLLTLNIKEMLRHFVDHRFEVIKNRTQYDLDAALSRFHIVLGLIIAVNNIDEVVTIIKKSEDLKNARSSLMGKYEISEKQANAILDMRLSRLTAIENTSLDAEKKELELNITNYKDILANDAKIYQIIKDETLSLKEKHGKKRLTAIESGLSLKEFESEDLIKDEPCVVLLTKNNYIKRLEADLYKEQSRGGKGVITTNLKEGDFVKQIENCMSKDYLLMVSSFGIAHWLKVYRVPATGRYSFGNAIVNYVNLKPNERISNIINTREFSNKFLTFITKKGKVKRIRAEAFSRPRTSGIRALMLEGSDEVADMCLSDGNSEMLITTKNGVALRFKETDLRPMGRGAVGVRGIRLEQNDEVVNILTPKQNEEAITISSKGYGKATQIDKYRLQHRGGKGVVNMKIGEKTGFVVKTVAGKDTDNLLLVNSKGLSIDFSISSIRVTGRYASGVRIMRLEEGVSVIDAQVIKKNGVQTEPTKTV